MTYLTHAQLGNHNAGEGSSQLSDLKMYGNRPYISGQAYRHAIREAVQNIASEGVNCTPRDSCGDLENCLICDLFGYMNTALDDPAPAKRVSPLRVTPLVGQYDADVTTDMILQYAPGGSRAKDEEGEGNDERDEEIDTDNRIGYRELTDNVYKGAWMLDCDSIGQRERESLDGDKDAGHRYERELETVIDDREMRGRILINALQNASGLAGQARHMADFAPDAVVATAKDTYSQRVTNAFHIEDGDLNIPAFESILTDLTYDGGSVWVAGTRNPTVMDNWDEFFDAAKHHGNVEVCDSVSACYDELAATFA